MDAQTWRVGDQIEVMRTAQFPIRGRILELDLHPLEYGDALIEVDSPCDPTPRIWINLRLARKV